ncbi:hypothetical protein FCH79_13275 [Pseudomonas koreensis]|nr:hypothetical protein [Pseudomonas koreensis]
MRCLRSKPNSDALLWRGSLLPLECAALPTGLTRFSQTNRVVWFATAAQSSGSKLPRHSD